MNKNYASWELTQLLPENNPNSIGYDWYYLVPHETDISPYYELSYDGKFSGFTYKESKYIRDAWTWEDIRLYLESKGFAYQVDVSRLIENNKHHATVVWLNEFNDDPEFSSYRRLEGLNNFDSYEEAREGAILYCLEKIKESEKIDES